MAAPSLNEFMSELRERNISKQNLYYVEIIPPGTNPAESKAPVNLVSMWCSAAQTPQVSIFTNDDYIENGIRRKYAYDQDYQNLTLTFYIDQDFEVKNFFDEWKKLIVPQRRNFNFPDMYTADILNLYIINQENNTTYKYEYSRVFPKTIQAVELSYASGTALSAFTVEFVYEEVYFTPFDTEGLPIEERSSKPFNLIKLSKVTDGITNPELVQALEQSTGPEYDDSPVDMSGYVDPLDSSWSGRGKNGTRWTGDTNGIKGVLPYSAVPSIAP